MSNGWIIWNCSCSGQRRSISCVSHNRHELRLEIWHASSTMHFSPDDRLDKATKLLAGFQVMIHHVTYTTAFVETIFGKRKYTSSDPDHRMPLSCSCFMHRRESPQHLGCMWDLVLFLMYLHALATQLKCWDWIAELEHYRVNAIEFHLSVHVCGRKSFRTIEGM